MATVPTDLEQVTDLPTSGLVSGQTTGNIARVYRVSRALQAIRTAWADLADRVHTHVVADLSDATDVTRGFLRSATTTAARQSISAQPAGDYATLVNGKVPSAQLPTSSATTDASALTSGTLAVARMAPGTTVTITKALAETSPASHSAGAWPTARPTLGSGMRVIFVGDTDPALVSGLRADGDLWFRA